MRYRLFKLFDEGPAEENFYVADKFMSIIDHVNLHFDIRIPITIKSINDLNLELRKFTRKNGLSDYVVIAF